jgi:hypothetical protein
MASRTQARRVVYQIIYFLSEIRPYSIENHEIISKYTYTIHIHFISVLRTWRYYRFLNPYCTFLTDWWIIFPAAQRNDTFYQHIFIYSSRLNLLVLSFCFRLIWARDGWWTADVIIIQKTDTADTQPYCTVIDHWSTISSSLRYVSDTRVSN